jgi:hypothetical protein
MVTRLRISAAAVLIASLFGLGLSRCDDEPRYVTVPSNAERGLESSIQRLLDAGLRASIREFPPLPCGYDLLGYRVHVQSPRAPARVKRGSVVELTVRGGPIPSPTLASNRPEFTTIPDLVGLRPSDVTRLDGIWLCLDEVPPLTPEASKDGLDAYVVSDQDLDPGLRVPYGGAQTKEGGYRPTVLHVRLAPREVS